MQKMSLDNARTIQNQALHMTYCPKSWCDALPKNLLENEHCLNGRNKVLHFSYTLVPQRNLAPMKSERAKRENFLYCV